MMVRDSGKVIKLAIMAVGGQGGGVLINWIESMARAQGFSCQATSVAGVAQRTGATIYYLEMAHQDVTTPVFSLAPAGGDVDIVIAAEMMEAGRAIMRGFVTPDRTTLIASTHRALAVSEKSVPGDGIAEADDVRVTAELAAQHLIMADFERLAVDNGSVISASLFGALAGADCLPFKRAAFEEAIRAGGRGVEASLRAFAAAYDAARGADKDLTPPAVAASFGDPTGPANLLRKWQELESRIILWPSDVQDMARAGLRKVVDFQDVDYGATYVERVEKVLARDDATQGHVLTREAAKYVANAMAYDDVIRVADIKTRGARLARIKGEMALGDNQQMVLTEYFHPRVEEIIGLLPRQLGQRLEANPRWRDRLDRWFSRGRRIRSNGLGGFIALYLLGGRRGWRLKTLRHAQEMHHLDGWLDMAMGHIGTDYDLAVELLRCRRLIKGYSDTHARGLSKFDLVTGAVVLLKDRNDAADWIRRLREAALADEKGQALDGALATVRSFTSTPEGVPA